MRISPRLLSSAHHDLKSFLDYATRSDLSRTSTVFVGTLYEYTVHEAVQRLGLDLRRTGGKDDQGIDLIGNWQLPTLVPGQSLRILVQCKGIAGTGVRPNMIRELEGAFAGAPAALRRLSSSSSDGLESEQDRNVDDEDRDTSSETMAMLVTPLQATKGVREAMGRSRWPLAYAKIALDGMIEQLLWNKRAAFAGLEGMSVSVSHDLDELATAGKSDQDTRIPKQEAVLLWNGEMWNGETWKPAAARD